MMTKKLLCALCLALCALLLCAGALAELPVQELPATADMYDMLDMNDPYKTPISGLFAQPITGEGMDGRSIYVYIGAENRQSEPFVMLLADSGMTDVGAFLTESGWADIAEEQGLIVAVAIAAEGGWDTDADIAYLNAVYTQTHDRKWYNAQKGNNYMLAYGDAATIAQMWAMKAPQNFASFATFGDLDEISADYMAQCAAQPTKLAEVSMGELPMPVWFFVSEMDDNTQRVLDYWNAANDVGDAVYTTGSATAVYMARNDTIASLIDEQNFMAQTRYTVAADPASLDAAKTAEVWAFLSEVIRPVGFANNALRAARSVEEWGGVRREKVIAGVNRYWIEFVPEKLSPTTEDGKVPLVVYCHGNNNTAEAMLARSELIKVANERGFIAILMTGALYHTDTMFPNPKWNLDMAENEFDDYAYIREAIAETCATLPIDTSRIYAMGQSYGGMASMYWALRMNDIFAAAATTGAMAMAPTAAVNPYEQTELNLEGNLMPICVLKGIAEGGGLDASDSQAELPYWLNRNGMDSDIYTALSGTYKSGRFNVYEFRNDEGIPLVQYMTVDDRIHTIVQSDLYFEYDNFVSKWSRGEDGTLYYMGKPVEK